MEIFFIKLDKSDLYLLGVAGFLISVLIGSILYRNNSIFIKRREERDNLINNLLIPFKDAVVNIEHGEHNHIFIMNALYERQKESISRAKAFASKKDKKKIETAWNNYKCFYRNNAEGQIISQFGTFPENFETKQNGILRSHMDTILKIIEKV